ncbi:hypothetical protein BP5796_02306 [Coleophoma crateriformis]|uniref:Uncharacterized protein n=1 Tax=Coleophoma crateriformis TaxID=565419 RepID=A0A3D8SY91_9HELO|nr:hypothetical protein BP5796_02306 [Coleophoma crateriformis]
MAPGTVIQTTTQWKQAAIACAFKQMTFVSERYMRLRALTRRRELTLRDETTPPKRTIESLSDEVIAALAAHLVGIPAAEPCDFCSRKGGDLVGCIVLPGEFRGACTNCVFASRRAACDFPYQATGNRNDLRTLCKHIAAEAAKGAIWEMPNAPANANANANDNANANANANDNDSDDAHANANATDARGSARAGNNAGEKNDTSIAIHEHRSTPSK